MLRRVPIVTLLAVVSLIVLIAAYAASGISVRILQASPSYYPRILAFVRRMPPAERSHALQIWANNTPEGHYGYVTPLELHTILWKLSVCTNLLAWSGCAELPEGDEDEGMAKALLDKASIPFRRITP